MKKLSVKDSAKKATMIMIICGVIATSLSTIWLLPGCRKTNIAGGSVPYQDRYQHTFFFYHFLFMHQCLTFMNIVSLVSDDRYKLSWYVAPCKV